MSTSVLVINGPNLNLLGLREPEIYGHETLDDIMADLQSLADERGVKLETFQSNIEGEIIDKLHDARGRVDGVVLNPGAFTHYSIAIRDAIAAIEVPVVETHVSNIHAREEWRQRSVLAPVCLGVVAGFGRHSYAVAFDALLRHLG
jgi:3-dehydroquinate dehydratase-2